MSLLKPSVALAGLRASAIEVCGTTKPPVTSDALLTKEKHRRAGNQTQLTEVIKLLPQVHLSGGSFIYRLNPWYWFRWLFEVNHKSFRSYQTIFDHFPTFSGSKIWANQTFTQFSVRETAVTVVGSKRHSSQVSHLKTFQRDRKWFFLSLCFFVSLFCRCQLFFAIKLFDAKETLWL